MRKRNDRLEELVAKLQRGSKRQAASFAETPPKAEPKPPGRKPGKDYATKAFRDTPATVDEEPHAPLPEQCPHCVQRHRVLQLIDDQYQSEIPTRRIHRRCRMAVGVCCGCHQQVQGKHPLQTSDAMGCCASELGPDALAMVVHLNKQAGLSHGKIRDLLDAFLIRCLISSAAAAAFVHRSCARRSAVKIRIKRSSDASDIRPTFGQRTPWAVPDETGWRVGEAGAWLHGAVGAEGPICGRREAGLRRLAAPAGRGRPRRDDPRQRVALREIRPGHAPYPSRPPASPTRLAHPPRHSHERLDNATGNAVRFPRHITGILHKALDTRDQRQAHVITPEEAVAVADELYQRIVRLTRRTKTHPGNERFAAHLFPPRNDLFSFLRPPNIDATNWRAEQAIRPAVVNRKVGGGNRTWRGAESQSMLISIWQTAAQNVA